ncbi:MAG: hypothetical protein DKINENOH_04824 [bacterium]|nr:hypothetical protein [bacterium]
MASQQSQSNPARRNGQTARAPYNFIPLPAKIVTAPAPPSHDTYHAGTFSGWIECELETRSPLYVRGMLTPEQYEVFGRKPAEELSWDEKKQRAPFFSNTEAQIEGWPIPAIPGSSLRGMVRSVVEIIAHGKMQWVASQPPFTFRAVAAPDDDPLKRPYQQALGKFSKNVRAGYLVKQGEKWLIRPAKTPQQMGWKNKAAYLKVDESGIPARALPNLRRLRDSGYRPHAHEVSFEIGWPPGKSDGHRVVAEIGPPAAPYPYRGVLVCSGNMLETGGTARGSNRKNHALVLEPDEEAALLEIDAGAIQDYRDGLTAFQKDMLAPSWAGGEWGCLKAGAPVFYVPENDKIYYFGHCPNFRIPARLAGGHAGSKRAARPVDFVPAALRDDSQLDFAEAIFGWVREDSNAAAGQGAGRVFFEDAQFKSAKNGVWLKPQPITLHPLASPKPTTFQHYLVQDQARGHDPGRKETLAHYGTPPQETAIRGHKLYWHKGENLQLEASEKELEHETQLTAIVPVKPGVSFTFRIRFENLRAAELGGLLWALQLPGSTGKDYCHNLGMGKPLGMGAVKITTRLVITDRKARYAALFAEKGWQESATPSPATSFRAAFEMTILTALGAQQRSLAEVERVAALLAMLEWRQGSPAWLDQTRYLEIEHGTAGENEYKERLVLPGALAVAAAAAGHK